MPQSACRVIGVTVVLIFLVAVAAAPRKSAPSSSNDLLASENGSAAALRAEPVLFLANVGQAADEALFMARGGGTIAAFARDAWWFQLIDAGRDGAPRRAARVALRFVDARADVAVAGVDPDPARVACFGGRATGPTEAFRSIRYEGVYDGVDVLLKGDGGAVRYDVHVAPHVDPSTVVVEVRGADGVRIDSDGALVVDTAAGPFRHGAPHSFETTPDGERRPLASRYRLIGADRFGFAVDGRDSSLPLVIDPVLAYATYLGGSGSDVAHAVATGGMSEAFVAGSTASADFPLTPGAVDVSLVQTDAFVLRLNYDGSQLLFATYLGGDGEDAAYGIAALPGGSVIVAGRTASSNFPTTIGAHRTSLSGASDGFVARITADGTALAFSSFLGGSGADAVRAVAVDASGAAHLAGSTDSSNFPTTVGALQPLNAGGLDAFVAKLAPNGGSVIWSTYVGGAADDEARGIDLDEATGDAFAAGSTSSADFPTTAGAWNTTANGDDGFACRIETGGGSLVYATRIGGSGADAAFDVDADEWGVAFVVGRTSSADFPASFGAAQTSLSGATDAFVLALDASGAAPLFATYWGGSGDDAAFGVCADVGGSPNVVGSTSSTDFPTTADAHQEFAAGGVDGFYSKFDWTGTALQYGTILGGGGDDEANSVACDVNGGVFVAGATTAGFPASVGSVDPTFNGGPSDAFLWASVFCLAKPSVFNMGGGCGAPTPLLWSTNGLLGRSFTMTLSGLVGGAVGDLFLSFAPAGPLVVPPCTVHVDPDGLVYGGPFQANGSGTATYVFHVTPDSFCCGIELVFQAVAWAPGFALSNGLRMTFGA